MKVPFFDLNRQYRYIKKNIFLGFERVLEKQDFILGKELNEFEQKMEEYLKSKFAVGVASGSDALWLSLKLLGVEEGDEVITTPFTHSSTIAAILRTGAKPILVDIDNKTFNIDPNLIGEKINPKTKAIIPVHMFGQSADMNFIMKTAKENDIFVVEDARHAMGAEYGGEKVGTIGDLGAFSFYPTKNLGCYGDGGMIVTNNEEYYHELMKIRNHGKSDHNPPDILGVNSRLDTLQSVVLTEKLKYLDNWNNLRMEHAKLYEKLVKERGLDEFIELPYDSEISTHVYSLYTIKVNKRRDELNGFLLDNEIGAKLYYTIPVHLQKAFAYLNYNKGDFPITEDLCNKIISLPIFPELNDNEIELVVDTIEKFYRGDK